MDFRNLGNPHPGAPGAMRNDKKAPGHTAVGAFERQTHEQMSNKAKAHDALAGELRARGESVSGTYLLKHSPGTTHDNDHFWSVLVRGPEVMLNWGKVSTPGKSEVRHFADALLAESWASDSVHEKLKAGYMASEDEGAMHQMRQEGMPREPTLHTPPHKK